MKGELVDALPESMKIIVSCAAGFDSYDGAALAKRGVVLCNAPGLASDPVADQVLYATLSLFRYYHIFERMTQEHQHTVTCRTAITKADWNTETGRPNMFMTNKNDPSYKPENDTAPAFAFGDLVSGRAVRQPRGHNVGIVGFGAIGKVIGQRLDAIGMNIHYTKTTPLTKAETESLGYKAIYHETNETLFPLCDLLVLACPLNASTHYMMNETTLAQLPKEARIINIGRGGLIDTKALVKSLKSGHLYGAALDVFEREPIVDSELCGRWDVILTPHIGSATVETVEVSENICIANIQNCILGDGKSLTKVN